MSPFRADRARAAALMPDGRFLEVFVDTPPEICRRRDVKDRKAESGRISNVTGLDQLYEPPDAPAVVLRATDMDAGDLADAADLVFRLVVKKV